MRGSTVVYDAVATLFVITMIGVLLATLYNMASNVVLVSFREEHTTNSTLVTVTIRTTAKTVTISGVEIYAEVNGTVLRYAFGNIDGKCELTEGIASPVLDYASICMNGYNVSSGSSLVFILPRNVHVERVRVHVSIGDWVGVATGYR